MCLSAAEANRLGPVAWTLVTLPFDTVIVAITFPVICNCMACGG
jgi:hypothetical protein